MTNNPATNSEPTDRLDSWKEIAAYLGRSVRTVHRWEQEEELPVHRHNHNKAMSIHAYRSELEAWKQRRSVPQESPDESNPIPTPEAKGIIRSSIAVHPGWRWVAIAASLAVLFLALSHQHFRLEIHLH